MAVLFDAQFRPLGKFRTKTRPNEGEKHFIRILRDAVRQLLRDAELNRDEILGIGVGCPGIINEKRGVVLTSPNIRFLKNYPLTQKVFKATKIQTTAANDVKAGLFGEQQFGAA